MVGGQMGWNPAAGFINFPVSKAVQDAFDILDEHAPAFASIIRQGHLRLVEGPKISNRAGGAAPKGRVVIAPGPSAEDTATALFEEIYHHFQKGGSAMEGELEARMAAYNWALKNNLNIAPYDPDFRAYVSGGKEGLERRLGSKYSHSTQVKNGYFYEIWQQLIEG